MTVKISAAFAALTLLLSACAPGIHVTRLDPSLGVATGVPWNLAMTQYAVTITRQVTSCELTLNGTVTISAVAGKTLDPDQQYVLSSKGIWATSDITSTLASDGTSTGLNAHSEDQTGQVVANIATMIATAAVAGGNALETAPKFHCADKIDKALKVLKPRGGTALKDVVDAETQAVTAATTNVAQLTAVYSAAKDKTALRAAYDDLNAKQAKLTTDQAMLNANTKVVTATQTLAWPPRASVSQTGDQPFTLPSETLTKWLKWENVAAGATPPDVDTSAFTVSLAIYASDGSGGWKLPNRPAEGDVKVGVPIRLPRIGRLVACTKEHCKATLDVGWTPGENQTIAISPDGPVLQLGRLYNVPLTGGTFKSEAAVIALDANGVPTSVEISERAAAAAAATSSAASLATTLSAIPTQLAAAKLARTTADTAQINANAANAVANTNYPTAALTAAANAQTALITATNNQAVAQALAPTTAQTVAANGQLALAQANANLATANANAAAAGPAGQLAAQIAQINQQNALTTALATAGITPQLSAANTQATLQNAQAAQINAQVALTKAAALLTP